MIGAIRTKEIQVTLQENGIIRDRDGLLIARLVTTVDFKDFKNEPITNDAEIKRRLLEVIEEREIDLNNHNLEDPMAQHRVKLAFIALKGIINQY